MSTNLAKIKIDELERLLVDFYTLTNMKICIYDSDGKELSYFPERLSVFCGRFREDEIIDKKCRACDLYAINRCKETRKPQIYRCHAGLTECIIPIVIKGNIGGFIAIGQIRGENAIELSDKSIGKERRDELIEDYKKLPIMPDNKIEAAVHVLEACAGYEELKRFLNEIESNIETRIEEFVANNLKENVGVESLCREFHFSRKELYNVIKRNFNTTPADFVKNKRLEYACVLLKTSKYRIAKVAEECGIGDYNYFSKLFKKEYGISPRQYRKEK